MFGKIFGRKVMGDAPASSPAALHPTIVAELKRLDLMRPGLARVATGFLSIGTPYDLPDMIKALYAQLRWDHPFKDSQSTNAAAGAVDEALVRGEIPPCPELGRLNLLRAAVGRSSVSDPNMPADRIAVLGLQSMLYQGLNKLQLPAEQQYRTQWELAMPLRDVWAHLRAAGGTMVELLRFVLTLDHTIWRTAGSWGESDEFLNYANTYPAALAEALKTAPDRKMAGVLSLLEQRRLTILPEVSEALIAMLAKPFGKTEQHAAISTLARLEAGHLRSLLETRLPAADVDTRAGLVEAAGRCGSPEVLDYLRGWAGKEKSARIRAALDAILEAGSLSAQEPSSGIPAIDGSTIDLPPRKDLGPDAVVPPTADDRAAFDRLIAKADALRRTHHEENVRRRHGASGPYVPFEATSVEEAYAILTGTAPMSSSAQVHSLLHYLGCQEETPAWFSSFLERQPMLVRLRLLPRNWFNPQWLLDRGYHVRKAEVALLQLVREWLDQGLIDLRDIMTESHLRELLRRSLYGYRRDLPVQLVQLPRAAVWPWIIDQQEVLDEALGLRPADQPLELDILLDLLALLPAIPQRYYPKLLDIALTDKKPIRRKAMALLRNGKDLPARLEAMLDDKRQSVRINAATWLADIRSTGSEGPLRRRLKREKNDSVRAALVESLQRLGFDLSDVIGPASLIAEAEAALAKAPPALPDWLAAQAPPPLHFGDGTTVPVDVVRHWLASAIRLKDPAATGQFGLILDQLEPAGAQAFSNWVLDAWITYDTKVDTLEEATAFARANYSQHSWYAYRSSWTPEMIEEVVALIIRERTTEPKNSGSDSKGMLALACRAEPVFAANKVRWFLKKHGRRSHQAMALLEVLAGIAQPITLQVVIAASARLKQKSTQARAAEIAQRHAEDRGWSVDELADRTVPSAGFDDDGILELPCGEDGKIYTARLDAQLAVHLFNAEGKPVKALPAGDDEATKESKKLLSAARMELAQVVELQGTRLFEAMCVERRWPVADWRMAFHDHPVMRRLVERLVWQGLDDTGRPGALFRPTQEGDFTDAADQPVDIDNFAAVRLAHGALSDAETGKAWQRHLADYEVKPFLAQFDEVRAPLSEEQRAGDAITDRLGWKADSLTYRGVVEKRGYERVMGDGGGCHEYVKRFPSRGIAATIFHTGSAANDENNPVALKELKFSPIGEYRTLALKDVPPVLLAECWADYHAAAAMGAFDPEWEKVSPW